MEFEANLGDAAALGNRKTPKPKNPPTSHLSFPLFAAGPVHYTSPTISWWPWSPATSLEDHAEQRCSHKIRVIRTRLASLTGSAARPSGSSRAGRITVRVAQGFNVVYVSAQSNPDGNTSAGGAAREETRGVMGGEGMQNGSDAGDSTDSRIFATQAGVIRSE